MDAAALLLLVSGVGVAFGWQPMPDGSQRYEYIVQLEPELAQTLAEGRSIPIVSDVPQDVQPIGRIRVVVGRNEPPRQRLVTRLKPATGEGGQDSAVQLAEYNRYGDDRYAAAPVQQPPTSTAARERPAANPDPYGAAQSRNTQESGESAWNSEQEEPPITPTGSTPPSGQELFGRPSPGGNSWNTDASIDSAANAAAQTVSQLGSQSQQNAQPLLQKGVQQFDSQVQAAADKFGNRTRDLVNELRQPFQQPQPSGSTQPQSAGSAIASTNEQSWNQGDDQAAPQNPLRGDQHGGATWNQQPQTSQPDPRTLAATPGSSSQSSTPAPSASIQWNTSTGGQSASPGAGATGATQQPRGADPWAGVPDPRTPEGAAGPDGAPSGIPGVATRPLPFGGLGAIGTATGPEFPNVNNATTQSPPAGQSAATQPAAGAAPSQGTPEVRSHMLQQPGDRPLDGVTTPGAPVSASTAAATAAVPVANTWATGAHAQTTPTTATANAPAATAAENGPAPAAKDNTVAILFAWVMLTGSVAGNFYLFWSYLDVRQKYRSLVRKTARAVGSRFSAA